MSEQLFTVGFNNTTRRLPASGVTGLYVRRIYSQFIGNDPHAGQVTPGEMAVGEVGKVEGLVKFGSAVRVRIECNRGGSVFFDSVPGEELNIIGVNEYEGKAPEIPAIRSVWKHHNGNAYEVYDVTNASSQRDDYPVTISYRNVRTGEKYSRYLRDWHRSMEPVAVPPGILPTGSSGFAAWWAMVNAQWDIDKETPDTGTGIPGDTVVLSFMGSGASAMVLAKDINRMMDEINCAQSKISWAYAQRLCDDPKVDEILRGFSQDPENDSAVILVQTILQQAGVVEPAPTETEAVAEDTPRSTLYTVGYDSDGNRVVTCTRSSSDPLRDHHLMGSFLELEQSVRLRNNALQPHKLGELWVTSAQPTTNSKESTNG